MHSEESSLPSESNDEDGQDGEAVSVPKSFCQSTLTSFFTR